MAEDWDLFAVVRGCASASATADESGREREEEPLDCLASLSFKDDADPFSLPNLKPLPPFPQNTAFSGVFSGRFNKPPPGPPTATSCSVFGQSNIQQQKFVPEKPAEIQHQQLSVDGRALSFSSIQSLGSKSRKRKTHQSRTICHMTADNLSADPWAWRKYGQKPNKTSPHPRNYYRCSRSKGCLARKRVERSNLDPNIFIVTFSGNHTHPKPTHRNSLAGSTRTKLSAAQNLSAENSPAATAAGTTAANASCSSPISSSTSVSPHEGNGEEEIVVEGESEEDAVLIPNMTIDDDDDLFNGLPEISAINGMGPFDHDG